MNLTHNGESQRGYKPALAQYDIAKHVSEQFYSVDRNDVLSKDDIFSLIYFADKYGAGSAHDCNGYTVMRFLRKVLVSFSEHNPKAGIINVWNGIRLDLFRSLTSCSVYQMRMLIF